MLGHSLFLLCLRASGAVGEMEGALAQCMEVTSPLEKLELTFGGISAIWCTSDEKDYIFNKDVPTKYAVEVGE